MHIPTKPSYAFNAPKQEHIALKLNLNPTFNLSRSLVEQISSTIYFVNSEKFSEFLLHFLNYVS